MMPNIKMMRVMMILVMAPFIEGIILLVKTQSHTFCQDLYIEKF